MAGTTEGRDLGRSYRCKSAWPTGSPSSQNLFIPEERNGHAAVPQMRLSENALLTGFQDDGMVKAGMVQQQAILSRSN